MTRRPLLAFFLVLAGALAFASHPGSVRAETRVVESTVENGYPANLTFHLRAEADVEITDVTLTYTITGRGSSGLGQPDDFTPAPAVDVSVVVNVGGANLIPVGSVFSYTWEITTADGEVLVTPPTDFLFLPPNREWLTLESDIMRVYYHGNREESARELLIAGEETYQRMAVDLLQTDLEVKPVKLILFVTEEEMDPAREGRSSTLDALTQTCGLKVTNDVIFVIQSCNSIDTTDVLRHELTHIINDAAGQGALGVMPAWLDEGTAVYAQSDLGSGFQSAITLATRTGNFIPFADMPLPASDPNRTNLFYGQSWAMVDFLIEREGPEEYALFLGS